MNCAPSLAPPLPQVLSQGRPAASPSGAAQLWLEGSLLLGAVGGLGGAALAAAAGRLRAALDSRLEAAVAAAATAGGPEVAELAAWAGTPAGRLTLPAVRRRLQALLEAAQAAARANLAPLRRLAAASSGASG